MIMIMSPMATSLVARAGEGKAPFQIAVARAVSFIREEAVNAEGQHLSPSHVHS